MKNAITTATVNRQFIYLFIYYYYYVRRSIKLVFETLLLLLLLFFERVHPTVRIADDVRVSVDRLIVTADKWVPITFVHE